MELVSNFQTRFRDGLKLRNLKASEISKKTGISKSLLSYYLNGTYRSPNANNIYLIAKCLDVSEAWLIGYDVPINGSENSSQDKLLALISSLKEEDKIKVIQFIEVFLLKNEPK